MRWHEQIVASKTIHLLFSASLALLTLSSANAFSASWHFFSNKNDLISLIFWWRWNFYQIVYFIGLLLNSFSNNSKDCCRSLTLTSYSDICQTWWPRSRNIRSFSSSIRVLQWSISSCLSAFSFNKALTELSFMVSLAVRSTNIPFIWLVFFSASWTKSEPLSAATNKSPNCSVKCWFSAHFAPYSFLRVSAELYS